MAICKKVLHLINGEFFAGAERVQDLLAICLPKAGVEVEFICLKRGVFAEKRRSIVPLSTMAMRSRFDIGIVGQIADAVKAKNFDLVHAHTPRSALIGQAVARKLDVPFVYHVHSPARRDTEYLARNWINGTIEEKLVLPRADKIITVSESLRDYLQERGITRKRISVIPNGVPMEVDAFQWKPPQGDWVIGSVALFRPRKGVEILLKALAILRDRNVPATVKLIGGFETDSYERAVRTLAAELGIGPYVRFHGFTRDVTEEIRNLSLFTLPSLYGEGMPMVLLEAMSVGLPVVASDIEGIPEVLHGGVGKLVPPGKERDLADAIQSLIENPSAAGKMAALSLQRHREKYSDIAMASAVASLYASVISLNKPLNY